MAVFQILKKVHWSDTDAAGIAWFPNFLGWFEDAEEEMFASLGQARQALLDRHRFGMPRVEVSARFRAPAKRAAVANIRSAVRLRSRR